MIKINSSVFVIFLLIVLSFSSLLGQTEISENIEQANKALKEQKYDEALAIYQEIEQKQYVSPELFHNMALAYAFSNKNVQSILYYEKALKFTPNNDKLLEDLAMVRSRIPALDEPIQPFFIKRIWNYFTGFLSATVWAWVSIIMMIVIALFCIKYLPKPGFTKKEYIILVLLTIATIKLMVAAYTRHQQVFDNPSSIVVQEGISLKVGADTNSPDIEALPAGSKVAIQDQVGEWLKVETALGDLGWVKAADVVQI